MSPELDKRLCADYPKIFKNRHASMQVTCMCWGFEIGEGWSNIIETLCSSIQWRIDSRRKERVRAYLYNRMLRDAVNGKPEKLKEHYTFGCIFNNKLFNDDLLAAEFRVIPEKIQQVVASQVKEKFGGLRFYYSGGDDVIDGMVQLAEALSYVTCEDCGGLGTRNNTGYIRTTCEAHR